MNRTHDGVFSEPRFAFGVTLLLQFMYYLSLRHELDDPGICVPVEAY